MASVEFFLYDTPKVMMLLFLVVFGVGIIRSFFTPEKTRAFLSGKSEFTGNVLAALLGIITPFCSCSAVPLFIGFVTAGVPLGVTFSFLIAAPMVNEDIDIHGLSKDFAVDRAAAFFQVPGKHFCFLHISGLDQAGPTEGWLSPGYMEELYFIDDTLVLE